MDGWTLHGCLVLGWSGLDKKGNNNWVDTDEVTQTRVVDYGKKEKSGENQGSRPPWWPPHIPLDLPMLVFVFVFIHVR